LTTRCNQRCWHCNRRCRQAPSDEEMSLADIDRFIEESRQLNHHWKRIRVMGGEPTLHKDLMEVIKKLFTLCSDVCLVTNGRIRFPYIPGLKQEISYKAFEHKHGEVRIGRSANIDVTCLDDGRDVVVQACDIGDFCGLGLSRNGFYCCGPGASIDRVLRLDVGIKSLKDVTQETIVKQEFILCKYCGHSPSCIARPAGFISAFWQDAYERWTENI